jgi:hypothetical protein
MATSFSVGGRWSTRREPSRQVDLIDYQLVSDSGYKWVLHYQYHFTKFSSLRSLKSKTAAEVAYSLLDICIILGAPMNLSGIGNVTPTYNHCLKLIDNQLSQLVLLN